MEYAKHQLYAKGDNIIIFETVLIKRLTQYNYFNVWSSKALKKILVLKVSKASLQHIPAAGQEQSSFSYMLETLCHLSLILALLDKSFLTSDLMNLNCSHIPYNPCNDIAVLECSGLYCICERGFFSVSCVLSSC